MSLNLFCKHLPVDGKDTPWPNFKINSITLLKYNETRYYFNNKQEFTHKVCKINKFCSGAKSMSLRCNKLFHNHSDIKIEFINQVRSVIFSFI